MQMMAIGNDGVYFTQDFEDLTTYPQEKGAQDAEYYVEGQGTWIYTNAFVSTNEKYTNGSTANLRLPKNGSYVITPVLDHGVKAVMFYAGRKGDRLSCYVSKDGGTTWTTVSQQSDGNNNFTINVNDLEVNRIKIANDGSGDADIDDLTVTAQAFGTPATVVTGQATDITKNSAVLTGEITDTGDQPLQESGFLWSNANAVPTLADNKVETENTEDLTLSVMVNGLKANQTIYFRAYALTNAGYAYGEVASFQTAEATMPIVQTGETSTQQHWAKITLEPKVKFSTVLPLKDNTYYNIRAYAMTDKGMAYGANVNIKTDEVEETPDEIKGAEIWCAPDGNDAIADGSAEKPFFDLQKAINIAEPGDRIWMKAGTYVYDKRINIDNHNGTPDAYIQVFAYGGRAILDFSGQPYHKHSDNPYQGIRLTSSYWHFYKIDITNASDNGMLIERNKPTGGSASDILARTQDAHDNISE